jgi:hypothetical protein
MTDMRLPGKEEQDWGRLTLPRRMDGGHELRPLHRSFALPEDPASATMPSAAVSATP